MTIEEKQQIMSESYNISNVLANLGKNYIAIINEITKLGEAGKNVYINLKKGSESVTLYSLLDDRNVCFQKVFGKSEDEYYQDKKIELIASKNKANFEKEKRLNNVAIINQRAEKVIYPQRMKQWKKDLLDAAENNSKKFNIIEKSLITIEDIENGRPFDEIKRGLVSRNDGYSYNAILNLVAHYSKQGTHFIRAIEPRMAENSKSVLNQIDAENKTYSQSNKQK